MNMPGMFLLFAIAMLGLWYQVESTTPDEDDDVNGSKALAESMSYYHQSLALYAARNPGVTGTPTDAAVGLPAWYSHPVMVKGYVSNGGAYSYCSCNTEVLNRLIEITDGSLFVGVAEGTGSGSKLRSPLQTNLMSLPAGANVPAGAVVYASK